MKTTRFLTYKKISKLAYTLGTLFLLCGLMLSMVNQPVSAGAAFKPGPTAAPGEVDPPERGPQQPPQPGQPGRPEQPAQPQPPAPADEQNPSTNRPGVVEKLPAGRIFQPQINKFRGAGVMAESGDIEFVQSDTPLCQIEPGWITGQVRVTLSDDVQQAELGYYWFVVHPDDPQMPSDYAGNPPEFEWAFKNVVNGEIVDLAAWWPGIRPTDDLVEIHWAATLYINDVPVDTAGLDFWYNRADTNMPCSEPTPTPVPDLSLDYACNIEDQTIQWSVTNPGTTPVNFDWALEGGESGSDTIAAGQTEVFHTSENGPQTMTITWADGAGGTDTASRTAEDCIALSPPAISRTCAADGIHWSITNPNTAPMTVDWNLSPDGLSGSEQLAAGATQEVAVTPGGAHTFTADSLGGSTSQSSNEGECTPALRLTTTCAEGVITWSVFNDGTAPASITWSLDGGEGGSGGGSVPAGDSLGLTTAPDDTAHAMLVTWNGGTLSSNTVIDQCSIPVPDPLTLSKTCTAEGIVWTVNNPRDEAVLIDWSMSPDGESGSEVTVPANGSVDVITTPGGAHTLVVTWDGGSDSLHSNEGECTPVPAITPQCNYTTDQIDWIVYNNGDTAVVLDWNLDNGFRTGVITLGAGESQFVTSTTDTAAHSMTITWATGSLTSSTIAGVCGGTQIEPLRIRAVCAANNTQMQWQVTNPNEIDVVFNWILDGSATTGTGLALAGGRTNVTTSSLGTHNLVIEWDGGTASQSATITACQTPEETETPTLTPTNPTNPDPSLTYLQTCSTATGTASFSVNNPSGAPITVNWSLDGGAQSGVVTIPPHTRVEIISVPADTAHTLRIEYPKGSGVGIAEVTSPACQRTVVTPADPTLRYECVTVDSLRWIVTNPGSSPVSFTWTLDGGAQTGSDTVPANGSREFLVTSAAVPHTVVINWTASAGALTASLSSPAAACGVPTVLAPQPTGTPSSGVPSTGATPAAMQPPASVGQGTQIQAVSGGNLAALPLWSGSFWQTLLQTLGLLLFGIAMVFHGLAKSEEQ